MLSPELKEGTFASMSSSRLMLSIFIIHSGLSTQD